MYVEDLKRGTNKDVGPKDIFEVGSILFSNPYLPPDRIACNPLPVLWLL